MSDSFLSPTFKHKRIYQDIVDTVNSFKRKIYPLFFPSVFANSLRLRKFWNKHYGERCFIIGNGPSLRQMDLSLLENEYTFGLNRFYLEFDKLGFTTTYFVSFNELVLEQFSDDIGKLPIPKFINWEARPNFKKYNDVYYLQRCTEPYFSKNVARDIWTGATVTFIAMQLAYYMGFSKIILIGVDHSFSSKGEPNKTIISQGEDPDHFSSEYFGKNVRWQLPDLETSELAYRMAKYVYHKTGRQIVDATVGGKLEVFEKVNYSELFP